MRFGVFTDLLVYSEVLWTMTPFRFVHNYRCFGGICCLYLGFIGHNMEATRSRENVGRHVNIFRIRIINQLRSAAFR